MYYERYMRREGVVVGVVIGGGRKRALLQGREELTVMINERYLISFCNPRSYRMRLISYESLRSSSSSLFCTMIP